MSILHIYLPLLVLHISQVELSYLNSASEEPSTHDERTSSKMVARLFETLSDQRSTRKWTSVSTEIDRRMFANDRHSDRRILAISKRKSSLVPLSTKLASRVFPSSSSSSNHDAVSGIPTATSMHLMSGRLLSALKGLHSGRYFGDDWSKSRDGIVPSPSNDTFEAPWQNSYQSISRRLNYTAAAADGNTTARTSTKHSRQYREIPVTMTKEPERSSTSSRSGAEPSTPQSVFKPQNHSNSRSASNLASYSTSSSSASRSNDSWTANETLPDEPMTTQIVSENEIPTTDAAIFSTLTFHSDGLINNIKNRRIEQRSSNDLWRFSSASADDVGSHSLLEDRVVVGTKISTGNNLKFKVGGTVAGDYLDSLEYVQEGGSISRRTRRDISVDTIGDAGRIDAGTDSTKPESTELQEMSMSLVNEPNDVINDEHNVAALLNGEASTIQGHRTRSDKVSQDVTADSTSGVRTHDGDGNSTKQNHQSQLREQTSSVAGREEAFDETIDETGDEGDLTRQVSPSGEAHLSDVEEHDGTKSSSAVSMETEHIVGSTVDTSKDQSQLSADNTQNIDEKETDSVASDATSRETKDSLTSQLIDETTRDEDLEKSRKLEPAPPAGETAEQRPYDQASQQSTFSQEERNKATSSKGSLVESLPTGNTDKPESGHTFEDGADSVASDTDSITVDDVDRSPVPSSISVLGSASDEEASEHNRKLSQDTNGSPAAEVDINLASIPASRRSSSFQPSLVRSEDVRNVSIPTGGDTLLADGYSSDRADVADDTIDSPAVGTTPVDIHHEGNNTDADVDTRVASVHGKADDDDFHRDKDNTDGFGQPPIKPSADASGSVEGSSDSRGDQRSGASARVESASGSASSINSRPTLALRRPPSDVTHSHQLVVASTTAYTPLMTSWTSSRQTHNARVLSKQNTIESGRRRKNATVTTTLSQNITSGENQLIRSHAKKPPRAGNHVIVEATLGIVGLSVIAFAIIGSVNLFNRKQLTKERETAIRDAIDRKRSSQSSSHSSLNNSAKRPRHSTPPRRHQTRHSSPVLPGPPKSASVKRTSSLPSRRTPLTPPICTTNRWTNLFEADAAKDIGQKENNQNVIPNQQQQTRDSHVAIDIMAAATGSR